MFINYIVYILVYIGIIAKFPRCVSLTINRSMEAQEKYTGSIEEDVEEDLRQFSTDVQHSTQCESTH